MGAGRHVTVTPWTRGEVLLEKRPRLPCRTDSIAAQTSRLGNGGVRPSTSSRMRTNPVPRVVAHRIASSTGVSVPVEVSHFHSKSEVPLGQFDNEDAFVRDGPLSRRSESSSWCREEESTCESSHRICLATLHAHRAEKYELHNSA